MHASALDYYTACCTTLLCIKISLKFQSDPTKLLHAAIITNCFGTFCSQTQFLRIDSAEDSLCGVNNKFLLLHLFIFMGPSLEILDLQQKSNLDIRDKKYMYKRFCTYNGYIIQIQILTFLLGYLCVLFSIPVGCKSRMSNFV